MTNPNTGNYDRQPGQYSDQYPVPTSEGFEDYGAPQATPKSKIAAALLAFFLGGLGVHNFYLGKTGRGGAQLGLTILGWCTIVFGIGAVFLFAVGIWAFVEFILILVGAGGYDRSANGVPLS